ncbi:MAG: pyrroline-5-carboxylate reductase dimerization domain-containing protein [Longimicrobiales bacterium]
MHHDFDVPIPESPRPDVSTDTARSQGDTFAAPDPRAVAILGGGAAGLMLDGRAHPEAEIDRVTTPRGCTIAGLNEMEHRGFSSAFIKAILVSAEKATRLYNE